VASEHVFEGRVMVVDHFGNLITNLSAAFAERGRVELEVAGTRIERVVATFAEASDALPTALVGSFGTFEIVVDRGSAARVLGASRGENVRLHLLPRRT
jgi:hypothetical protein